VTSCRFRSAGSGGLGYNLGGCISRGGLNLHRCHSHRVSVGSLTAFIIPQDLFINLQQPFTHLTICCGGIPAGDPAHIKIMRLKNIIRVNLTNGIFQQTDR